MPERGIDELTMLAQLVHSKGGRRVARPWNSIGRSDAGRSHRYQPVHSGTDTFGMTSSRNG
jgi:hypothetical protein